MSARSWRAALVAAVMVVGCARAASAGDAVVVAVDADGAAEQLTVVSRHGHPAIRLTLERGRTVWLRVTKPLRHLVAGDLDHDGDIDLIATTEGNELVAWFNHGRGRFTTFVINPRPPNPLGPRGPGLEPTSPSDQRAFGIGADALPARRQPLTSAARLLRVFYSSAVRQTPASASCGPRAPPAA